MVPKLLEWSLCGNGGANVGNPPILDLSTETARRHQAIYAIPERDFLAWKAQRDAAKRRGIPFRFTLLGWRVWWRLQLKLLGPDAARGRSRSQYVMARLGDKGAYEVGNVRCVTAERNAADIDPTSISNGLLSSWARRKAAGEVCHLAVRGAGHPRSKPVMTPRGRFESAALAADAFGITRQYASQLARMGQQGWSRA